MNQLKKTAPKRLDIESTNKMQPSTSVSEIYKCKKADAIMKTYISEIILQDERINKETADLYESLGLSVVLKGKTIRLNSTHTTHIVFFDGNLKLYLSWDHYNRLMNEKILDSESGSNTHTIYDNIGTEISLEPKKKSHGIRLGILTSGGDSPGMNSAVRSIVRYSLKNNIKVFGIYRGFDGLIRGDIRSLGWDSETHSSGQSGTYLLSARSNRFKTREGRKEAAYNLFIRNINALVVIGGEGTMEGALILKNEFKELCKELIAEKKILQKPIKKPVKASDISAGISLSTEKVEDIIIDYGEPDSSGEIQVDVEKLYEIQIVGIPGTIDNDIAGTDFTLGSNTAITRVFEVVEKLTSTMRSHKRVFVLECMGRNCGWITLMAGFAVEAEYILIPEIPCKNWREDMIRSLKTAYFNHKLNILVCVSEGAINEDGSKITIDEVTQVIENAEMDVRSIVIGHVQRGGLTTAQDRFLGTLFGLHAVEYIMNGKNDPVMIGNVDKEFIFLDLKKVVDSSKLIEKHFSDRAYDAVLQMRSAFFREIYQIYELHRHELSKKFFREHLYPREYSIGHLHAHSERKLDSTSQISERMTQYFSEKKQMRIAILAEGLNSGGMNTVLNSLVQFGLCKDIEIFYFFDGYNGLRDMNARRADIFEFSLVHALGGIAIGTSEMKKMDAEMVERKIEELQVDFLVVIGGTANLKLANKCKKIVVIPTTIANNFPGTDMSIGSDTALNAILTASEASRLTASSYEKSLCMIEIGGGKCGYLTIMAGISCSAFEIFYPESSQLEDLVKIKERIRVAFEDQRKDSVIIFRNRTVFENISTEALCQVINPGGDVRCEYIILGHLERGISPSVQDCIMARLSAYKAIELCLGQVTGGIVGIKGKDAKLIPIAKAIDDYDETNDIARDPFWLRYSTICSLIE